TSNYGVLLMNVGRLDEAEALQRRAVALAPLVAGVHKNLGDVLVRRNRIAEAASCYREALALDPAHGETLGALLNAAQWLCDWPERGALEARLLAWHRSAPPEARAVMPFPTLSMGLTPAEERAIAARMARQIVAETTALRRRLGFDHRRKPTA